MPAMDFGADRNDLLVRLMSASTLRAKVLSDNVANQNVPGFKRSIVRFEELLKESLESGSGPGDVEPRVEMDLLSPSSPDGNNVSLEVESNAMKENWIAYQMYAQVLQSRNDLVKAAITEGR